MALSPITRGPFPCSASRNRRDLLSPLFSSLTGSIYGIAGYFAGGSSSGYTNYVVTADKIVYSTDTTSAQASANLSQARRALGGLSAMDRGYFLGGTNGSPLATADKTVHSTDTTAAQASANLSVAREGSQAAVTQRETHGYCGGGTTGTVSAVTDKLVFATDTTAAQVSANLSVARVEGAGMNGGSTKGYFAGGVNGSSASVVTVDKVTFSNDTTAAESGANLNSARHAFGALSQGLTHGYWAGGYSTVAGTQLSTAEKTTFATDTTATAAGANLGNARFGLSCSSQGSTKGYMGGGRAEGVTDYAITDKITYATDTRSAQSSADLSGTRQGGAGLGGAGI